MRHVEGGIVLVLLLLSGCRDTNSIVCVPVGPAVTVMVFDSVTNAPAATNARGVAERAGIVDSLVVAAPDEMVSHQAATPGTFTVRIEKAGYVPWSATLVVPPAGTCGPHGVRGVARLQPDVAR